MAYSTVNVKVKPVILAVSAGTGLSLLGDSALYTVLPLNFEAVGVTLAQVGLLLSVNRIVRLVLNAPAGSMLDRWPRRRIFIPALFLGALSTGMYALTRGFPLFLAGRLLWGVAWTGIWVGGNSIVLDVTSQTDRGRVVGMYQAAFFLGAATGSILGGILTDWLGFRMAMTIGALLTLSGAIWALIVLPETRRLTPRAIPEQQAAARPVGWGMAFITANLILGITRFAMAGVVAATVGLYFNLVLGDTVSVLGRTVGVTTITGVALGANIFISMIAVPFAGRFSDRSPSPWRVVSAALLIGVIGFVILAQGTLVAIIIGLVLASIMGGSLTGLATVLIGGLGRYRDTGKRLGVLYTVGDLGSALGPPLALNLLPLVSFVGIYLGIASILALLFLSSFRLARAKIAIPAR